MRQNHQIYFNPESLGASSKSLPKEKAVVGVMEVVKGPYSDPAQDDERLVVVDVKPLRRFDRPVSLAEIKSNPKFADFALVRISRLSVMPVTAAQWNEIERLSKQPS
jgi:predicted RNA-binding protein with PUA-like domain